LTHGDAVKLLRRVAADIAQPHIATDGTGIAIRGRPEPSTAGRFKPHTLTLPHANIGHLRCERRRSFARIGLPKEAVERAGPAAPDAEGRELSPLAKQEDIGAAGRKHFDFVDRSKASTVPAGAGAVGT